MADNNITDEDIDALRDMHGSDSSALEDQLAAAKRQATSDTLSKPMVEDMVKQQSLPGRTAEQAAETLAPKELPVPTSGVYNTKQLRGAARAANAAAGETGKGIIELGPDAYTQLPAVIEKQLPAVIEKAGLPAVINKLKSMAPEQAMSIAEKIGGTLGKTLRAALGGMGEDALGPLAVGYEALRSPEAGGAEDYPPNLKQQVIQSKNNKPSLFDMVSDAYKKTQEDKDVIPGSNLVRNIQSNDLPPGKPLPEMPAGAPDYLKNLMDRIYGPDADQKLKDAQSQQRGLQAAAMMLKGGNIASSGLAAGGGGNIKPQLEVANQLEQDANQPVQDLIQQRQAKMQQLEAGLKASDLVDKEQLRDPNSDVSKAYRSMALTWNPNYGAYGGFNTMSAEAIKNMLPGIDMQMKMQTAKDNHQLVQMQKQQADEGKAKADMTTRIATMLNRGAPAKAMDVDRRVDNINSLTSMYPDLSKMPQNQVNALTDEITQIVTGGMSTEGKSAKLMNPTLASGFQNLMGKTLGHPTGAQLGSFIQEYLPYMADLQGNARSYIKDQITPIMVGYNKRIQPSDMEEVKQAYSKYFQEPSKAISSKIVVTDGVKTYRIDPKDLDDAKKDGFKVVQ